MKCCFLLLLLPFAAFAASAMFVDEVGETEIIPIDDSDAADFGRIRREIDDEGSGNGDLNDDDDDDDEDNFDKSGTSSPSLSSFSPRAETVEGSGEDDEDEAAAWTGSHRGASASEEVPTTTTVPDVEIVVDRAPHVQRKLQKYPVTAGRSIRIVVPEDTFFDREDGSTRNLKLELLHENGSSLRGGWLRFDPDKQAVYALPVNENDIGRWKFILRATDREGQAAQDLLEIVVRQYRRSRLVNHQFDIEFSFTDWDPASTRNWQWTMLETVQRLYGDRKPTNIVVREAREEGPRYVFGWTNDTLTRHSGCPKSEIDGLFGVLEAGGGGEPSDRLKALLGSKFSARSVSTSLHGACLHSARSNEKAAPTPPPTMGNNDNSVPVMRNPVDRVNVTAGELLRYKVPADTCYDREDGGTEHLDLRLLTPNRRELPPDGWLRFDPRNQEFAGIPLEEEVGRSEYQLVCSDRSGLSAVDGIEVIVHNRPFSESFPVEFALAFAGGNGFRTGKVRIVESIAGYFGDPTPANVVLKTFDGDAGRMVWFNKSLAHLPCDHERLRMVRDALLLDGKPRPELARAFDPYAKLVSVDVVKRGGCASGGGGGAVPATKADSTNDDANREEEDRAIFHGIIPSSDYLLTFIVPTIIIVCMLALAVLLACVLHRRRKAGKLNLFYSESLPPRVPVILQDELYDESFVHHRGGGEALHHASDPFFSKGGSLSRPTPAYRKQ